MARRVDTKFAAMLGVSVVVLLAGGFVAKKWLMRKDADPYAAQAKVDEQNLNWKAAVADWNQAIQIAPNTAAYHAALGNDLHNLAAQDPEITAKREDRAEWEHALELDPTYV